MTAAPTYLPERIANQDDKKKGYFFAHPSYVCPSPMLSDLVHEYKYLLTDETGSWVDNLALAMAGPLKTNHEAVVRRMYDVMNGRCKLVRITYAEAACIAFGIDLDMDTDIPTLPGNQVVAQDLIEIRADMAGEELEKMELKRLVKRTLRLSSLIIQHPHHYRMLCDLAPFDCLRPPR